MGGMLIRIVAIAGAGLLALAFIADNGDMLQAGAILLAGALIADGVAQQKK